VTKPKMSCLQLTMAVMLNMLGSSIILMPTKLAEVGTLSILSWVVTITGATTIAYVFAKCGMFSRKTGALAVTPPTPSVSRVASLPISATGCLW